MAITIEVTRGRYVRHLREAQGLALRDCCERLNAVLPANEQVSKSWVHLLERDSETCVMTPLRALALRRILGADPLLLGVDPDDWQAFTLLTEDVSDLPAIRPKRGRDRPKRSSTCFPDRVIARPNTHLKCTPHIGALSRGGVRAHRS